MTHRFLRRGKILSVAQKDSTATVSGTNFYSTPKNPFSASVRPSTSTDDKSDVVVRTTPAETATSFALDASKFDAKKVAPGCYLVVVNVGTMSDVSKDKLQVAATPKITAARKNGDNSIEVTGEQLISTKDCGGTEPTFEILDDKAAVIATIAFADAKGNATKVTLAPKGIGDKKVTSVHIKDSKDAPTTIQ